MIIFTNKFVSLCLRCGRSRLSNLYRRWNWVVTFHVLTIDDQDWNSNQHAPRILAPKIVRHQRSTMKYSTHRLNDNEFVHQMCVKMQRTEKQLIDNVSQQSRGDKFTTSERTGHKRNTHLACCFSLCSWVQKQNYNQDRKESHSSVPHTMWLSSRWFAQSCKRFWLTSRRKHERKSQTICVERRLEIVPLRIRGTSSPLWNSRWSKSILQLTLTKKQLRPSSFPKMISLWQRKFNHYTKEKKLLFDCSPKKQLVFHLFCTARSNMALCAWIGSGSQIKCATDMEEFLHFATWHARRAYDTCGNDCRFLRWPLSVSVSSSWSSCTGKDVSFANVTLPVLFTSLIESKMSSDLSRLLAVVCTIDMVPHSRALTSCALSDIILLTTDNEKVIWSVSTVALLPIFYRELSQVTNELRPHIKREISHEFLKTSVAHHVISSCLIASAFTMSINHPELWKKSVTKIWWWLMSHADHGVYK